MNEVLYLMLPLAVSVIVNIALGMYYNIGTQKFAFDYKILLNGIIKASIVGGSFIGLAYVIDTVAIFPEETPQLITVRNFLHLHCFLASPYGLQDFQFPNQGMNPGPQQWKHEGLTTGPPVKSHNSPTKSV